MKVKILIGILIFLILINLATIGSFLYYQWRTPPVLPPSLRGSGMQSSPELNLNRAQRHQLRTLLLEFKAETEPLNNQAHLLEDEIFALIQKDTPDKESVDAKLEKLNKLRLEISKKVIDKFYDTRHFLSPQQQKHFFNALMNKRPMGPGPRFRKGRHGSSNPQHLPSRDLRFE